MGGIAATGREQKQSSLIANPSGHVKLAERPIYNAMNASLGKGSKISDQILGGASAQLHVAVLVNSQLAARVASSLKMS
jgi:hypothetical protein